jgi:hypothetical protein
MIHIEDYELEAHKDLVYLQEEKELFYRSLNDPGIAQIEAFMSDKLDLRVLESLQEKAKINVCIPESLIDKIDRRIIRNYEHKINALSFQRTS